MPARTRQSRPRKSETPNSLDPVERFYESPRNYDEAKDTHMTEVITRPSKGATKAPAANKAAPSPAPVSAQTNETTSPGASPSLIVLSLRPNGAKFNGNRIERAQEAGFDWLKEAGTFIGWSCPDTGLEIARHVVNRADEAMGKLREIQVHIDLGSCALHWRAGTRLMEQLTKYAILIGGHICDGMGIQLDDQQITAVTKHIDAAMELRYQADREARTVESPNGEQRELSELSFMFEVLREAGAKKKSYRRVHFAAKPMHYHEGRAKGMQMAGEVVQFYRKHKTQMLSLDSILSALFSQSESHHGSYEKALVANVAQGFLDVIETLVTVGARHLNEAWLTQKIDYEQHQHAAWLALREKNKAELVERLRKGREAAPARRAKGNPA